MQKGEGEKDWGNKPRGDIWCLAERKKKTHENDIYELIQFLTPMHIKVKQKVFKGVARS